MVYKFVDFISFEMLHQQCFLPLKEKYVAFRCFIFMKSQDDSREKKYDLLVLLDVTFKTEAYHYMCVSVLTNYFQYPDKNLTSLKIPTAISYE